MKAITLTQPWATLVAIGAKRYETRSWSTEHRGELAIHAAKGITKESLNVMQIPAFRKALAAAELHYLGDLPRGAVIATCTLVDVTPTADLVLDVVSPQEREFGDFTPGRYAWTLEDVKALAEPVPARGALSLWEWER